MVAIQITIRITIPQTIRPVHIFNFEGAFSSPVLQHSFILLDIFLYLPTSEHRFPEVGIADLLFGT